PGVVSATAPMRGSPAAPFSKHGLAASSTRRGSPDIASSNGSRSSSRHSGTRRCARSGLGSSRGSSGSRGGSTGTGGADADRRSGLEAFQDLCCARLRHARAGYAFRAEDRDQRGDCRQGSQDGEGRADDTPPAAPKAVGREQSDTHSERTAGGGDENELGKTHTDFFHKASNALKLQCSRQATSLASPRQSCYPEWVDHTRLKRRR